MGVKENKKKINKNVFFNIRAITLMNPGEIDKP